MDISDGTCGMRLFDGILADMTDEDMECSEDMSYKLPVDNLVAGLSQLYEEQLLCDAEIQVDGKVFKAHRLVLAASSTYFQAAYVGTFKEAKSSKPLVLKQVKILHHNYFRKAYKVVDDEINPNLAQVPS